MPRKEEILIYKFDELSPKAQDVARDWYRDSSLSDDWWENVYENAANVGLKITSFEADRRDSITGDFTDDAESCAKAIVKEHGFLVHPGCETYKVARFFLDALQPLQAQLVAAEIDDDARACRKIEDQIDELRDEFKREILEEYLSILKNEVECLSSDEYVDETIRANEYEFLVTGKRA